MSKYRGHEKLYKRFRKDQTPTTRRRRNSLMPHRNTALAARYHYHTHLRRLAYEDALAALEEEFFITGTRIIDILTGAAFEEVERLAKAQPTSKELAARYPQWSW